MPAVEAWWHLLAAVLALLLPYKAAVSPDPLTVDEALTNVPTLAQAGNRAALDMYVTSYFHDDYVRARAVVECESRWDPHAVSETADFGLFQLNVVHWSSPASLGWGKDPLNVADNVTVARQLYEAKGWAPWTCARILGFA